MKLLHKAPAKQWDCSSYEKHQKYVTCCWAGYIRWVDLYNIYDKGNELKSNLGKPPKLSYLALHPGNNKQNVPLALETTITAARSYFPNWRDVASFLEIFNTWWTISNSKQRFSPNILRNAVINGTKNWVFKSSGRLDWTNTSNCVISMWELLDCIVIQLNDVSPSTGKWVAVGFLTICEKS